MTLQWISRLMLLCLEWFLRLGWKRISRKCTVSLLRCSRIGKYEDWRSRWLCWTQKEWGGLDRPFSCKALSSSSSNQRRSSSLPRKSSICSNYRFPEARIHLFGRSYLVLLSFWWHFKLLNPHCHSNLHNFLCILQSSDSVHPQNLSKALNWLSQILGNHDCHLDSSGTLYLI